MNEVAVMGGSHGGFLTGNLVGQYPATFKCGVLRNPVMDLGLMIHCSDIPDWTYIEAFGCKVKLSPSQQQSKQPYSPPADVLHWLAIPLTKHRLIVTLDMWFSTSGQEAELCSPCMCETPTVCIPNCA